MHYVRWFRDIGIDDVPLVGGKNASLGEMLRELGGAGIQVPNGFALTAEAYYYFLDYNNLREPIRAILDEWRRDDVQDLVARSKRIRNLILKGRLPGDLETETVEAYCLLSHEAAVDDLEVAVRSSATAEDLPNASFAGQQETFLHVHGEAEVLTSIKRSFASLFTARGINYREDMGFDQFKVGLSVGVQRMVGSDGASSGVMFTLDTESGCRDVVLVSSIWGLGENIVQGRVGPDDFLVHKPTLEQGYRPIVSKKLGTKEFKLVYDDSVHRLKNVPVQQADRERFSIDDDEVLQLARWAIAIEAHYSRKHGTSTPMDIEWAKDSVSGQLFIVQGRPETVHSQKRSPTLRLYQLQEAGSVVIEGLAVGGAIASGPARVIADPSAMDAFQLGEVLVTEITNPDWEPIMKVAAAIVTERGGRTSDAAIVARELGIPAVVGAARAMRLVASGQPVTVSCAEGEIGRVDSGELKHVVEEIDPTKLPPVKTKLMMNVGKPEQALALAQLPNDGVGLARMEFIFASAVGVHPLALTRYHTLPIALRREVDRLTRGYVDKTEYFVDKLARGIATISAAFWPKPVILRFSDFKTNEYAHLLGGEGFEPQEANPMIGWRRASRYYHPDYKEGFLLEVAAVKRVRGAIATAILFTLVYNSSRASRPPALLLQAAYNTTGLFLPRPSRTPTLLVAWIVAFAIVVVAGPGRGSKVGRHSIGNSTR